MRRIAHGIVKAIAQRLDAIVEHHLARIERRRAEIVREAPLATRQRHSAALDDELSLSVVLDALLERTAIAPYRARLIEEQEEDERAGECAKRVGEGEEEQYARAIEAHWEAMKGGRL